MTVEEGWHVVSSFSPRLVSRGPECHPAGSGGLDQDLTDASYSAWSDQERRWVEMTFPRYQAWLTRPDLDPAEFDSDEVTS